MWTAKSIKTSAIISVRQKQHTHTHTHNYPAKSLHGILQILYYVLRKTENRYIILNHYYYFSSFRCASYITPKRSVLVLARDIYISCSKSNRVIWSRRGTTGNVRKLLLHLFDDVSLF